MSILVLRRHRRAVAAPVGPTTYISDGFSGASATLAGRTPDTTGAATWSVLSGTWNTDGSVATCASANAAASINAGAADGSVSVKLAALGTGALGILFRATDNLNYWYMIWETGTGHWKLVKVVTNAATIVDSSKTTPVPVAGDTLKVVLSGSTITAFLNSTQILTAASGGVFDTITKHGLKTTSPAGTESFDDFLVTA